MKLIMTLLVRNEEDILKQNLDFHLNQGVDFIIATDNRSTDTTKEILKEYQKKGVLHYLYENENTHNQGAWVTRMARMASTHFDGDWIINNDADEFWWPTKHPNLKEALSSLSSEKNIIEAQRHNFVFIEKTQNNPFYQTMIYKECPSLNSLGKPLPPKQAHKALNNIKIGEGNHKAHGFEDTIIAYNLIEIFHFPIRSVKQFINKIDNGGNALNNNTKLARNIGITWRSLSDELITTGNLDSFFDKNCFNDSKTNEYLHLKKLVKDDRLQKYLDQIYREKA